jgi:hypothetical protein
MNRAPPTVEEKYSEFFDLDNPPSFTDLREALRKAVFTLSQVEDTAKMLKEQSEISVAAQIRIPEASWRASGRAEAYGLILTIFKD